MNNGFDVIIVGAGVIGSSVARYLSRFKLNCLVLEKHNDVGDETTNANSAIVHSGYDPLPGTNKAIFNVRGNKMMGTVCEELGVTFHRIGSLTVSFSDEEDKVLEKLLERSKENGVDARLVEAEELFKIEPNLNREAHKALLCKDAGIVSPFSLCVNLMENAMDNGIKLRLNTEVTNIIKTNEGYEVVTKDEVFKTKVVVNAAGLNSDLIASFVGADNFKVIPRKGEYYVLDHFNSSWVRHTLFMCPTKFGKGILISPTSSYNYLIGPTNDESDKFDTSTTSESLAYLKEAAKKLIPTIPFDQNIRQFTGIRANSSTGDFIIEESKVSPNFFNLGAIMSPGLASSVAIGEYVSNLIKDKLELEENTSYNPTIRPHYKLSNLSPDKFNDLVKKDPRYGHMICRCEKISEGEIVDAIHRNCGATTVKGIKKRVRPGFGKCQGTFCEEEVIKILARELNKDISEICYSDLGTEIMKYNVKGNKND